MTNEFAMSVIANIFIVIAAGLYYNYCIEPLGNRVRIFDNAKFPLAGLSSVFVISIAASAIAGWFIYGGALSHIPVIADSVKDFQSGSVFADIPQAAIYPACVYLIFVVPVAEELMYRGFFFRQLYAVNKFTAYYMSVLFFALSHGNIIQMIPATFGGVLYAMIYAKSKSLRVAMVAHMLYNALALLFSYLTSFGHPTWLYGTLGVSVSLTAVLVSLYAVCRAPMGLEIKDSRPRILTAEEKAAKEKQKSEYERIFRELEAEKIVEEERRQTEIEEARKRAELEANNTEFLHTSPETTSTDIEPEAEQPIVITIPAANGEVRRIYIDCAKGG
jgi:membrane protease YdiL (CAAX protease family)